MQTKYLAVIAIATTMALANPVQAGPFPEKLDKELTRKYSPRQAAVSGLKSDGFSQTVSSKNIGPYIAKDYFNAMNASPLGRPAKRLKKFCEKELSGEFKQIALMSSDYKLSVDPIILSTPEGALSFSAKAIFDMTNATPKTASEKWTGWHAAKLDKLSGQERLGIFSCNGDGGAAHWTAAVIPTRKVYREANPVTGSDLYQQEIAILPLDKVILDNYGSVAQDKEQLALDAADVEREKNASITQFQKTANIGSESSCGLIIQSRGALVEIDLKPRYAKSSGKSTSWLKREKLIPDGMGQCNLN